MDIKKIWQAVLAELELSISRANFKTWLQNTYISKIEKNKTAVISVPNAFTKSWLEQKYHKVILSSLSAVTDSEIESATYEVGQVMPDQTFLEKFKKIPSQKVKIDSYGLNLNYTFANFVAGKENELACAAAQAAAKYPGKKYNPLFIYGGVGLGKTHLLQAVGHSLTKRKSKFRILYTDAEEFTNEFVSSIRSGTMKKFRQKYRALDAFLIDDIQFMAGKKSTQEEFFHTFNALHHVDKQIVITSDRPPNAIPALEDRLVSRFQWGLIADIIPPGLEMRLAILKAKCQERKFSLSDEVLDYLADQITNNIRELEGALNKLRAYQDFYGVELSLPVVKSIVSSLSTGPNKEFIRLKEVIETVAGFYNIKVGDMIGSSRKRELVEPRQVTMYLLREELELSFPLIGKELGHRDHTTVMHSYEKVKKQVEEGGKKNKK